MFPRCEEDTVRGVKAITAVLFSLAFVMTMMGCASGAYTAGSELMYQKLGLSPLRIEPWEDGARTTGAKGTYEWWYFDFNLDDGSTLVITYLTKDFTHPETSLAPFVTFTLDRADGTTISRVVTAPPKEFHASQDRCDVRIGANSVSGDLHDYVIHFADAVVQADLTLHGTVPPWRPGTGISFFGKGQDRYFAWLPAVPQGSIEGNVTIAGESREVTGVGYHDHNWGNASMLALIHDWYWGRAQIGGYTVIASFITASDAYGSTPLPLFMLASEGAIIADDSTKVRFSVDEVATDSYTGKPVASVVVYDYDDGDVHYRVTFRRAADLVRMRFIDNLKGMQAFLARAAGFDGAYLRFTGTATLERFAAGQVVETVSQKSAVWELMYFGHAPGAPNTMRHFGG